MINLDKEYELIIYCKWEFVIYIIKEKFICLFIKKFVNIQNKSLIFLTSCYSLKILV